MLATRAIRHEGVRCFRVYVEELGHTAPWQRWTVDCPRRGRIGLEHCIDCPQFAGLRVLSGPQLTLAACRFTKPELVLDEPPDTGPFSACTKVSALLATNVVCLSPGLGVDEVSTLLVAKSLSYAPVVDEASRPIGLISKEDLLLHATPQSSAKPRRVLRDVMRPLLAISDDATASDAAEAMWSNGVECLAVVSPSGRFEGLVSAADLLPCLLAANADPESRP